MTDTDKNNTEKDKVDYLWRIICRFDFYINSTNTKAAFLIAFNIFVLGLLISDKFDILNQLSAHAWIQCLTIQLICIIIISSLISLHFSFLAVNPYVASNKKPGEYHSSIFFGDVDEYSDADVYCKKILAESSDTRLQDLARQAHVLSKGLNGKFLNVRKSISTIRFCLLPALFILFVLKRCTAIIN